MNAEQRTTKSPFVWSAGAWFGSQIGGSAWALVLAIVLLFRDIPAALVCLGSFAAFNAYGLYLWRSRETLTAYAGIQRLLLAFTVLVTSIIAVVNVRGISESPTPLGVVPTQMSYRYIALPVVFMLWFCFWDAHCETQLGLIGACRPLAGPELRVSK